MMRLALRVPARREGGGALMAMLRAAVKAAAAAVPKAQLARLGLPALLGTLGLAVLVLAAVCWVLESDARCERVAKVLGAWRLQQQVAMPRAFSLSFTARGVERVVERVAMNFRCNQCFRRYLPCRLCR